MKKRFIAVALIATQALQAQILYVNNADDTYRAIDTKETKEVTFDEEQQLVKFSLQDGTISSFATKGVESISLSANKKNALTYSLNPTVAFDTADSGNYNEVTEAIPEDELHDDYGDYVEKYTVSRVVTITFSENSVKVGSASGLDGFSYTTDGAHIVINSERSNMAYRVKGTSSNGSLKIYSLKKFLLMASGVNLTNPTGPAINIQSGKTVYFTISNGTTNSLCDGSTYNSPVIGADGTEEDQKGTLFSEGQLIFDGSGTLNVTSLGGHAICSDDYIRVRSGKINIVEAAKDGFRTKDKFIVTRTAAAAPTITINATNNGIDCSEGTLTIEAGKLEITSGSEAIKVEYEESVPDPAVIPDVYIKGGYIKIATTGEKSSAIKVTRDYIQSGGIIQAEVKGNGSKIVNCDNNTTFSGGKLTGFATGSVSSDSTSAGGIKCNGNITITDGTIAIECSGRGSKGFNCNGTITIDGGSTTLLSLSGNYTNIADDKKSRAITTGTITVNGGKLVASAYDNAISATGIEIGGGSINAYSTTTTALNIEAAQSGGWLLTKDAE